MCGIAAIVVYSQQHSEPNLNLAGELHWMLGKIAHRGTPESFAETVILDTAALGTNRLPIVKPERNEQPAYSEDSDLSLIFNGEIYNSNELQKQLNRSGITLKNPTDTELILLAYQYWGTDCVQKFNGMFAFIIYSKKTGSVFAARDQVGIKPLYFVNKNDAWFFASEKKALIHLYSDISELPPSTYFVDGKISPYYFIDKEIDNSMQYSCAASRCNLLIHQAVRRQVNTELPIGVVFSGGVDSAIILYLANLYHRNVKAYTVGSISSEDIVVAKRFCEELGIPLSISHIDQIEIRTAINSFIYITEQFEPVDITDAIVVNAAFSMMRRDGIRVALSGDGSDEIFAGYDLFLDTDDPRKMQLHKVNNLHITDLQRVDRVSMWSNIECRVPFLDLDLVNFALAQPIPFLLRNGSTKALLRDAFQHELPEYIVSRPKMRMSEGSGINSSIFKVMAKINISGVDIFPDEDTSLNNCVSIYKNHSFPEPYKRIKQLGYDYKPGGWTNADKNIGLNVTK